MSYAAIIDYDEEFSPFNEFLFKIGKLKSLHFEKDIIIEGKKFKIFKIPITKKNLYNNKKLIYILNRFIKYIKDKKIEKIILSDKLNKIDFIKNFLFNKFRTFDGKSVIKFNFSYIIKKCIKLSDKENSEIIIYSNSFNEFYDYFNLLYENYRINSLVTDYKNIFMNFLDEVFNNYGFYINIENKEKFIYREKFFYLNIDIKEDKNYFDLDLNNLSLIFMKNDFFYDIYQFIDIFDEKCLEYIIFNIYGDVKKEYIKEIFLNYNLRIVKINKK